MQTDRHKCAERQTVAPGLQQAAAVIEEGANWLSVAQPCAGYGGMLVKKTAEH